MSSKYLRDRNGRFKVRAHYIKPRDEQRRSPIQMTQIEGMSMLQATTKLKITTARNTINLWKNKGKLYPNDSNKTKAAEFTRLRQLAKSTRRHLMITINVPDRPHFMLKIERPASI